jgi:hypothetical protein
MPKLIHIPKIGHVEFPDNMPDGEIAKHASRLHSDARSAGISRFMENDPAHQGMSHSERLKALSTITGLMEKYPRLADAVDKGMGQVTR